MDEEKKRGIIELLKPLVIEENAGTMDDDYRNALKGAIESGNFFDIDDEFHFDPSNCIERCDGHCCRMVDMVHVSPVDVDFMMELPLLKGIPRKMVVEQFLDIFLGGRSLVPMATIKFVHDGTSNACPFIVKLVTKTIAVNDDLSVKIAKINGVCALGQEFKPSICMLYPLGRLRNNKKGHGEWIYFSMKCPGTSTGKTIKIRDYIGSYMEKADENSEYQTVMIEMVNMLKEKHGTRDVEKIMTGLLLYLYMENGKTRDKVKKIRLERPTSIEDIKAWF